MNFEISTSNFFENQDNPKKHISTHVYECIMYVGKCINGLLSVKKKARWQVYAFHIPNKFLVLTGWTWTRRYAYQYQIAQFALLPMKLCKVSLIHFRARGLVPTILGDMLSITGY